MKDVAVTSGVVTFVRPVSSFLSVVLCIVLSSQTGDDLEAIRDVDLSALEASVMDVAGDDAEDSGDGDSGEGEDSDDDR